MDSIIAVIIIALIGAIILGSLFRGFQRLMSFVVLLGLAAFAVIRLGVISPDTAGEVDSVRANAELGDFAKSVETYLEASLNGLSTQASDQVNDTTNGTVNGTVIESIEQDSNGTAEPGEANEDLSGASSIPDSSDSNSSSNPGDNAPVPGWW